MGIEEFASVANEVLNVKMNESTEAIVVTSVPLGGYKDAKNGFPKIKLIFGELSPERRILRIFDLDRIDNRYELAAVYTPDYSRVAQDSLGITQNEIGSPYQEEVEPDLRYLADQDKNTAFKVTVQTILSDALGRNKDIRKYNPM